MMRRREFITLLGGAAAWPLAAQAQQPAKQRRIAIFHPAIPTTHLTETGGGSAWRAFFGELRRLGYVEGENLIIERYSAEGHHERYSDLVREIVTRNPDVIVTGTNPVVIAFKAATSTIPVVAFMLDPLHAGLVTSLGRPGGNLTGITLDAGIEIWGKRLASRPFSVGQPAFGRQSVAHCLIRAVIIALPNGSSIKCSQGRCGQFPVQFGPRFGIE